MEKCKGGVRCPHDPMCKAPREQFESHYGVEKLYNKENRERLEKEDLVNHPPHYKQYEGFEVIDITKQLDFLVGNAVKYILRAPYKGTTKQDYEKAIWYLNKKLEDISD